MGNEAELLPGTLDLLILKAVSLGPLHGYGLLEHIYGVSYELLQVEEGSLYPALHRMEQDGWISAKWEITEKGRKAKMYSITLRGEKQLAAEHENWERLTRGVARVLRYS